MKRQTRDKVKSCALAVLVMVLLTTAARNAYAVWTETQLTPQNVADHASSFTIKTKNVEGLKEFEVIVEPKAGKKLSPVLSAHLRIVSGETETAYVPVESQRDGDKVTYWFRVAPNSLAKSRFDFGEHGYGEQKGADGKTIIVPLPGGDGYWFYLRDFADAKDR